MVLIIKANTIILSLIKDDIVLWNNTDYLMIRESDTTEKDHNKILNIIITLK